MQKRYHVFVMPGEGIGPEIIGQAERILRWAIDAGDLHVEVRHCVVGLPAFEATGSFLPREVQEALDARSSTPEAAILYGATSDEPIGILRKRYDLFANLRPARILPGLEPVSPLRGEIVRGTDLLFLRELTSDVYYGEATCGTGPDGRWASQAMRYTEREVRRFLRTALELAGRRGGHLTVVHKANAIPEVYGLWLDVLEEERRLAPDVRVETMFVDNMAMQLMLRPAAFDVVATSNLFGDILSEIGAGIVGSLGLIPSASWNESGFALYEPAGGTAPDIAGQEVANPLAAILSVAMLCEHTFRRPDLAQAIHDAAAAVLARCRTRDIAVPACATVSTSQWGEQLLIELGGRSTALAGPERR